MIYDLPTAIDIGGSEYSIRSDYRAILDIIMALSDPDISEWERVFSAVSAFYVDYETIPCEHEEEAIQKCFWFINGGTDEHTSQKHPRLVDWEQDFPLIISPVNKVLGKEARSLEYLHWWSFLGAYKEIGDCTFANVVSMRNKLAKHKKLDKSEKEWLRENRDLVEFKKKYTDAEENLLNKWI